MADMTEGPRTVTRHFDPEVASAGAARAFLREVTAGTGIDLDAMILVASELVNNAISHAQTPFTVTVTLTAERVRIAVTDASTKPVIAAPLDTSTPGGFGMHLVARLAADWGTSPLPDGKTVWFETPALPP